MRINLLDIRLNGGKTRKPVGDKPLPIVPAQHRDRFMASVSPRQKLPAAFSVRFGEKLETDRPSNEKVGPSDHLLTPPSTEHPAQATASSGVTSQAVSPMEAVGAIQPIEGVTVPPILRSILVEAQATAHKTGFPQIMLEHFAYAAIQHLSRVVMPASGPAGEKPNPPSQGLNQGLERAMLATSDLRRFSKQDFQLILPLALANTGIELSDAESASIKAPQKTIPLPLEPFLKEALQLTSHEDPHQQLFELMQYLRENDDRPGGSALEFLRNTSSGLSTRLSKEHFMEKLTKTSPALKFWLTEASAYAKLGGSSTIGIKHLISAAIDTALPLMDKAPEQMNIHSKYLKSPPGFDVYTARRSLDALLPPQIRENLSAEQVKTILREASHSLDTLIYPKHYPYGDAFVEPSLSPSLSGFLTRNTYVYHSPVGFNAANFIAAVRTDLLQSMPQHTLEDTAVQGILSRMVHRAVNSSSLLSDVTFDDIGGYTREKEQLKQFADFAKNPAYAEKVLGKGKFQRGLLLHGPTGTGKTYMVKALANYIGIPVIERNGTDLMTKYINSGPENIGKLFDEARSHKRALIFIDEIDALLRRRDSNGGSSSGEEGAKAVNKFLGELDGFIQNNPGIIVVGATNRKDVIDTAALRPGRLGTHIEIGLPDPIARKAILKIHTKDSVFAPDLDVDKLVTLTPQFSAAELAQLALQARIEAFNKASSKANPADAPEQPFVVGMDDFMDAYDTNYMGAPNPELHQTDFDKALVGNHEIKGHGFNGLFSRPSNPDGHDHCPGHIRRACPDSAQGRI